MTDTTTVSPQQTIEDLAPWPDPDRATADQMARWFTVQAFAAYCRLTNHPCWQTTPEYDDDGKPAGAYADGVRQFVRDGELAWSRYVAAYLLRRECGSRDDMPLVDALRREVDSAEMASETVGDWLVEYGIDAEAIVQAVRAERVAQR